MYIMHAYVTAAVFLAVWPVYLDEQDYTCEFESAQDVSVSNC